MPEYTEFLPKVLPAEPLPLVSEWLQEAVAAKWQPNPNAMVLATATRDGRPSARVVLLKGIVPQPGYLAFYTNYHSSKGRQLTDNPRAAAVLHWDALHRQVRIEGPVALAPPADSDAYFASRAWGKRIGAWASQQSEPLPAREDLLRAVEAVARRFGAPVPGTPEAEQLADTPVPRPPHWGGYRLWAESVELWCEGDARVHDRARWTRTLRLGSGETFSAGPWSATRLQP
ncbi:MAG: pyridoxamine 5'-phosphate oxidase [Gammaproteobacteria bacterium]|nr:pyridoxamine 5'-phosphate oxidase [Gammaproteobacteria bacterium]